MFSDKPLTLMYGVKREEVEDDIRNHWSHITHYYVHMKDLFGKHHS